MHACICLYIIYHTYIYIWKIVCNCRMRVSRGDRHKNKPCRSDKY